MSIKKKLAIVLIILLVFIFESALFVILKRTSPQVVSARFWPIVAIDTMKYSRDASSSDLSLTIIDSQVKAIAETGATHISIATPYDLEFLPRLKQWVNAARKYKLKVWFRGNFSAWEGWFDHQENLTRNEHKTLTQKFILDNPNIFEDGDIFTPCPECENGGAGDPRQTGDVTGFRNFMIEEYQITQDAFKKINKKVISNYASMNGDVAKLVMDKDTTKAMGGIVAVDDYVSTPDKLSKDINDLAASSGGRIVLGEYGTPIPDLTGDQTEDEQAKWMQKAFVSLINNPNLVALNYWVSFGGSTKLWNDDGTKRKIVDVISSFYKPQTIDIKIVDANKYLISQAPVNYLNHRLLSNKGHAAIPYIDINSQITVTYNNDSVTTTLKEIASDNNTLVLPHVYKSPLQIIFDFFK